MLWLPGWVAVDCGRLRARGGSVAACNRLAGVVGSGWDGRATCPEMTNRSTRPKGSSIPAVFPQAEQSRACCA